MRRPAVAVSVLIGLVSTAAIAQAATPAKGGWSGSKSTTFQVNPAGTKITDFRPGGCATGPLGYGPIKVHAGGFTLTRHVSLMGGRPVRLKISGRFTSATAAKGTVRYGSCTVKFKATADDPPPTTKQPVVPDPTVTDPGSTDPPTPYY